MITRRELIKGGAGVVAFTAVAGFGPPACPLKISKDKAVRYTDLAINYFKDASPLLNQLGGAHIVALIDKAIPALEKLKARLEADDFPAVGSLWDTIENVLNQVNKALAALPESPRLITIMGIVALVNLSLHTVKAFVESETPPSQMASVPQQVRGGKSNASAIRASFEASRY